MPKREDWFYYENPRDPQNDVTIYTLPDGGLHIAVADEKAVDSYNDTFECEIELDAEQAVRLRDYLVRKLK